MKFLKACFGVALLFTAGFLVVSESVACGPAQGGTVFSFTAPQAVAYQVAAPVVSYQVAAPVVSYQAFTRQTVVQPVPVQQFDVATVVSPVRASPLRSAVEAVRFNRDQRRAGVATIVVR